MELSPLARDSSGPQGISRCEMQPAFESKPLDCRLPSRPRQLRRLRPSIKGKAVCTEGRRMGAFTNLTTTSNVPALRRSMAKKSLPTRQSPLGTTRQNRNPLSPAPLYTFPRHPMRASLPHGLEVSESGPRRGTPSISCRHGLRSVDTLSQEVSGTYAWRRAVPIKLRVSMTFAQAALTSGSSPGTRLASNSCTSGS